MTDENKLIPESQENAPINQDNKTETPVVNSEFVPENTPKTVPESTPETAPEATPETAPEATPAVTPEAQPQVIPEIVPDAAAETIEAPQPEVISTPAPEVIPAPAPMNIPAPEVTPAPAGSPYGAAGTYGAPNPQYAQPQTPYVQPQQGYTAPQQPYAQPQQPYAAPYTAPYNSPFPAAPYANPQYAAPQPPAPKKKSVGARVMLICLWVLLGLFSLALIGACGYYLGQKDFSNSSYLDEFFGSDLINPTKPTEPATSATIPEEIDDTELYGEGEIILNKYPADKADISKYNTQSAFEKVSPSTVGIMCYTAKERETLAGQGTGVIVNTDGYIATNSHVIGDSKNAFYIDVVLSDGNVYEAKVVGFDTRTDLAVIKISAKNLVPAEFADSDLSSIGEDVIAVGNPGGIEFQNTLTRGVISAKDRTLDLNTQVSYIQTDAAINPGNSGGPLCNTCGQVIGINSAKIADSDYEGMGFAIPSRTVKDIVDDLIKQGYVSGRVKIGITGTALTASQAQYNNVPQGILVAEVVEGGPCDNGKIQTDDIITKLDDYEIKSFNDIYTALMNYSEGDKVTLTVYRMETDEYFEVKITLQADNGSTR